MILLETDSKNVNNSYGVYIGQTILILEKNKLLYLDFLYTKTQHCMKYSLNLSINKIVRDASTKNNV